MSKPEPFRVQWQEDLAIVNLAQGDRGNPFDGPFTAAFRQVAGDLMDAPALRAVLLRADGPNFSLGGDLKALYPARSDLAPLIRRWTADLHMGLQRFWHLPVPVVCAVQGYAMGGGVALLAGCDVVLAGEKARFGSAFAQIGFSCDSGSTTTLTARMSMARARRFVMLAEQLSSAEAMQAGLVDQVVADDSLQEEALKLATRLASGPTKAYGEIKRLFLRAGAAHLEAQLEDEALTLARVATGPDAQEGIAALVEKRKASFVGR